MNILTITMISITYALPSSGSSNTLPACPTTSCTAYEMHNKISQKPCILPNGTVSCVVSAPWSDTISHCCPTLSGYKC